MLYVSECMLLSGVPLKGMAVVRYYVCLYDVIVITEHRAPLNSHAQKHREIQARRVASC